MNRKVLSALLPLALVTVSACNGDDNTNAVNTAVNRAANTNVARANANAVVSERRDDVDWNVSEADFKNKTNEYKGAAERLGDKIGSGASDLWIWTKIKSKLAAIDDFPDTGVNVDVENGAVTLKGSVASAQQKQAAEAAVNDVKKDDKDVKGVTNSIQVAAASPAR